MIILFESTATNFRSNGLGYLPDATKCEVTEERNGAFELDMVYPINGKRYEQLALRRILLVKTNPYSTMQAFRIYTISKPINGLVEIFAGHISYDMSGYPVTPFTAENVTAALNGLVSHATVSNPFRFWTDKTTVAKYEMKQPYSMRTLLGGVEGSILDRYRGEYEFDNFLVKLHNARGSDYGVSIRYGKNLTDLEQEENCASVYTGVYPFWYSTEDGLVQTTPLIIPVSGTFNYQRVLVLDLSYEWIEKPTPEQLKTRAEQYIQTNNIGKPKVSLTVSFVSLAEEDGDLAILERVHLCDTVQVAFPDLGVSSTAKCIKTKYDVLTGKYISIELGESRANLADTISSTESNIGSIAGAVSNIATSTGEEAALRNQAIQKALGNSGGYVVIRDTNSDGYPEDMLVMNRNQIAASTRLLRLDKDGIYYSKQGVNGVFNPVFDLETGGIYAEIITEGFMRLDRLRGGVLHVGNEKGYIQMLDANGNILASFAADVEKPLYVKGGAEVTGLITLKKDGKTFRLADSMTDTRLESGTGVLFDAPTRLILSDQNDVKKVLFGLSSLCAMNGAQFDILTKVSDSGRNAGIRIWPPSSDQNAMVLSVYSGSDRIMELSNTNTTINQPLVVKKDGSVVFSVGDQNPMKVPTSYQTGAINVGIGPNGLNLIAPLTLSNVNVEGSDADLENPIPVSEFYGIPVTWGTYRGDSDAEHPRPMLRDDHVFEYIYRSPVSSEGAKANQYGTDVRVTMGAMMAMIKDLNARVKALEGS